MTQAETTPTVDMIPLYIASRRRDVQRETDKLMQTTQTGMAMPHPATAELALAAGRAAATDFNQARTLMAQALQSLSNIDPYRENQHKAEPINDNDAFITAGAAIEARTKAKPGAPPAPAQPNDGDRRAAHAIAQDSRRQLKAIADTAVKESKGRYQNGPYRTASTALAAAHRAVRIAEATRQADHRSTMTTVLLATARFIAHAASAITKADDLIHA